MFIIITGQEFGAHVYFWNPGGQTFGEMNEAKGSANLPYQCNAFFGPRLCRGVFGMHHKPEREKSGNGQLKEGQ